MKILLVSLISHVSLPTITENMKNCSFHEVASLFFVFFLVLVQALVRPTSPEYEKVFMGSVGDTSLLHDNVLE